MGAGLGVLWVAAIAVALYAGYLWLKRGGWL